eukprot:4085518-Pyramimonas_sp.AAC.1
MGDHRYSDRDLACPGCAERGVAPGNIDERQCEDCLEHLASVAFDKHVLYHAKRRENARLVLPDCQMMLRCGTCTT